MQGFISPQPWAASTHETQKSTAKDDLKKWWTTDAFTSDWLCTCCGSSQPTAPPSALRELVGCGRHNSSTAQHDTAPHNADTVRRLCWWVGSGRQNNMTHRHTTQTQGTQPSSAVLVGWLVAGATHRTHNTAKHNNTTWLQNCTAQHSKTQQHNVIAKLHSTSQQNETTSRHTTHKQKEPDTTSLSTTLNGNSAGKQRIISMMHTHTYTHTHTQNTNTNTHTHALCDDVLLWSRADNCHVLRFTALSL